MSDRKTDFEKNNLKKNNNNLVDMIYYPSCSQSTAVWQWRRPA